MLISRPIRLRTTSAPCSPVNSFTTTSNNYIAVNIVVFPKRYRLAQPFPILILAIYRATTSRSSKCCHSRTGNFENTCKSVEQLFRMIFTNYKVINANCTFRSLSMKFSTVLHLGKYASLGTRASNRSIHRARIRQRILNFRGIIRMYLSSNGLFIANQRL